ncbi:uncharacterized protein LOC134844534 isoform X2 [Symsagittifera roscoffensis]|uniref:uncharacterized protein LOC134844534 isoform X2 n=1 Tax=Symsagittifera roscoffensis TaxID=84072 RepID=UPI00307B4DE7
MDERQALGDTLNNDSEPSRDSYLDPNLTSSPLEPPGVLSSNDNNNRNSDSSTLDKSDRDSIAELIGDNNDEEHINQKVKYHKERPPPLKLDTKLMNGVNNNNSDCVVSLISNDLEKSHVNSVTNPYYAVVDEQDTEIYLKRTVAFNSFKNIQAEYRSELEKRNSGKVKRKLKKFYSKQDDFIESIEDAENSISVSKDDAAEALKESNKAIAVAAKLSFVANVILMIAKLIASYLSGSMAILSSLVDSVVDLVSGAVIFYTTRAAKRTNFYSYPFGRTRLEPAAIIIISVVMGLASLQVQIQSLQQIITWSADPHVDLISKIMVFVTVVMKLLLFLYCRRIHSPSTRTLATDHFNDIIGNSFALACGWVASQFTFLKVVDPIGAILISFYICYNWWKTGSDQIKVITGKTAPPSVLAKITWLSLYHDTKIRNIDTVRAFHLGSGFLTDVHVTLDENMSLREAHDIGESLQNKLELLSEVEVAFVHLDYENDHKAFTEHAFLMRKPISEKMNTPRSRTASATTNA